MENRPQAGITVNAEPNYAYYSRYVNFEKAEGEREIWHLQCPHCKAEEIVILHEWDGEPTQTNEGMVGDKAQCWICKKTFTITSNCWKLKYQTF